MTFSRPPQVRLYPGEICVDHFAGGGGASLGIEWALGQSPHIAINHDKRALAMHQRNHPHTKHYQENIWEVDPTEACAGRPVGLLWASPDCKHFSRAKGETPVQNGVRGLAWVLPKWAKAVRPRVMILENVPEFETWGPLHEIEKDGKTILRPDKTRAGETFHAWLRELSNLGYSIEYRVLTAADYGAPTTRKRLFLIAHRDRDRVTFPRATHGKGRPMPWVPAHEIIDWSLPCQSIFARKKPLAQATLNRIAAGVDRYVVKGQPFIVQRDDGNLVLPWITKHYGGMVGNDMHKTLGAITAVDSNALSSATLSPVTSGGEMQTAAFLMKYYKSGVCKPVTGPLDTVRTKGCFALIEVRGVPHRIVDIGTRMLQPHELYAAQGFDDSYEYVDAGPGVKPFTQREQIRMCGNAVPPPVARALVEEALAEG